MARIGFCSGAYQSSNLSASAQECINLFFERNEADDKSAGSLLGRPGMATFGNGLPSFTRGYAIEINGRIFYPSNDGHLYELNPVSGARTDRGVIGTDQKPVSLAASATQLMIASAGQGYCLTLQTNVLTGPIATLAGVIQVDYGDGFFVALIANSGQWFVSTALDGTNWNPGQTTIVSVFPGNIAALKVDHREVVILGQRQSVFYYDSGNVFPYDVIPGSFIELGSGSPFGVEQIDNSLFWWHQSKRGGRMAYKAQAYNPQRISTHAIEAELESVQNYPTITDAFSFAIEIGGHSFWGTTFPSAFNGRGMTWVYDTATGMWARWTFRKNDGLDYAFRACGHVYVNGQHLVGDTQTGGIYQLSLPVPNGDGTWQFGDDFGNAIIRDRRSPYVAAEGRKMRAEAFELELETGLGQNPAGGGPIQGVSSFILQSPNGSLWSITMLDAGILRATANAVGIPTTVFLRDKAAGLTAWQVTITNGGILQNNPVAFANYPQTYYMGTNPSGNQSGFQVSAGGILSNLNPAPIPKPPQATLKWSDDRGKTWSNGRLLDLGALGQYGKRVIARMLGQYWGTSGRIWRLIYSDKPPLRISDAYQQGAPGLKPTPRLSHQLRAQG